MLEQFQTDTADFADIVLPVTTFLEHSDLYFAYGHYYVQAGKPRPAPAGRDQEQRGNLPAARKTNGIHR